MSDLYDRIGAGYATTRRTDPAIAAQIDEALGDARTVVNIGAGTGSYEPAGREVTAVEPSAAMVEQRPPGAAPCVQAAAEELPFADDAFDAAMAAMTIHHWSDVRRGLSEMRRVARSRVVVFTWDPAVAGSLWLAAEYLPEFIELEISRFMAPGEVAEELGGADVRPVPIPRDCRDGFIEAFWGRPEAYLDPTVRAGMSGMVQLDQDVVERAMARLSADLESGEWDRRHGRLRSLAEMDLGYRLVVAGAPSE